MLKAYKDPYEAEFARSRAVRDATLFEPMTAVAVVSAVAAVLSFIFDRVTDRQRNDWQNGVVDRLKHIEELLIDVLRQLDEIALAISKIPIATSIEMHRNAINSARVDFDQVRSEKKKLSIKEQCALKRGPFFRLSEGLSQLVSTPNYGFAHYNSVILALATGVNARELCPDVIDAEDLRRDVVVKVRNFLRAAIDEKSTNILALPRLSERAAAIHRIKFGDLKAFLGPDNTGTWFRTTEMQPRNSTANKYWSFWIDRQHGDPTRDDGQEGYSRGPEQWVTVSQFERDKYSTYVDFPVGKIGATELETAITAFNERFRTTYLAYREARRIDRALITAVGACNEALPKVEALENALAKIRTRSKSDIDPCARK